MKHLLCLLCSIVNKILVFELWKFLHSVFISTLPSMPHTLWGQVNLQHMLLFVKVATSGIVSHFVRFWAMFPADLIHAEEVVWGHWNQRWLGWLTLWPLDHISTAALLFVYFSGTLSSGRAWFIHVRFHIFRVLCSFTFQPCSVFSNLWGIRLRLSRLWFDLWTLQVWGNPVCCSAKPLNPAGTRWSSDLCDDAWHCQSQSWSVIQIKNRTICG